MTTAEHIRLYACQTRHDGSKLLWLRGAVLSIAQKVGACSTPIIHLTNADSARLAVCQKRFDPAHGIPDADLNARQGKIHLLFDTYYGDTISSGVPGIGGGFNGPWNDKDEPNGDPFFTNPFGMSGQTETTGESECGKIYERYAAAYNEETGLLYPRLVIDNLIRSKACRTRNQDVAYILSTKAVAPSARYKPWC